MNKFVEKMSESLGIWGKVVKKCVHQKALGAADCGKARLNGESWGKFCTTNSGVYILNKWSFPEYPQTITITTILNKKNKIFSILGILGCWGTLKAGDVLY